MTNTTKQKATKFLTWVIVLIVLITIIEGFLVTIGMAKPLNWVFLGSIVLTVILLLVVYALYWWTNRSN
ncbi:hypothetical protein [Levilactobacillus koreensis]|uniref:hypothetical protein n=1 Tax=Levilactobacillus koreensis TaxID=637971 RepID=UPI0012E09A15|nr:hypothetical protein [Levilactobacillus koreensis]